MFSLCSGVLDVLDSHCSGRKQCTFPVNQFVTLNVRPCPKDVTSYLEASYRCLPGENNDVRVVSVSQYKCKQNRARCLRVIQTTSVCFSTFTMQKVPISIPVTLSQICGKRVPNSSIFLISP